MMGENEQLPGQECFTDEKSFNSYVNSFTSLEPEKEWYCFRMRLSASDVQALANLLAVREIECEQINIFER